MSAKASRGERVRRHGTTARPAHANSTCGKDGVQSCASHVITFIAALAYLCGRAVGLVFLKEVNGFFFLASAQEKSRKGKATFR